MGFYLNKVVLPYDKYNKKTQKNKLQ